MRAGMTRRMSLPWLVSLLALASCAPQHPPTLESIVEANASARGGARALGGVRSIRMELEIAEPKFTVRGVYRATRAGMMRIDIFAGAERVFTEAVAGDGAWQMLQGQTTGSDSSEDGRKALRRGLVDNLYGLFEQPALGYRLSYAGEDTKDGRQFWVVDQTAPDGFAIRLYVDPESRFVARAIERSALHPDVDSTAARFETRYSDFRATDGVVYHRKSEKVNLDTGAVAQTVTVKAIEINPPLDANSQY
jgi:hypothetical protein